MDNKTVNTPDAARQNQASRQSTLALAVSALAIALQGPTASAQVLEEVIVTAQKRMENLQDTPLSISAFQGDALEAFDITGLDDLARTTPSITFAPYPNSNNLLIMFIRGQGVGDPAQITIDGSVGIYLDGFYIARPQGSTFDLADLERVEVLRGPQGTLYGRNTTGGAVNLISRQPSGEFGFKQTLTFGSRDEFRSLSVVDLPEWSGISTKLSILASSIDGWVDNPGPGEDFGQQDELAGRLDLNWQLTESLVADFIWETGELDSTPNYHQNPAWNGQDIAVGGELFTYHQNAGEPKNTAYRPIELDESTTDYDFYGLTLTWDISDSLSIRSLTSYRELEWQAFQDFAEAFAFIPSQDPDFFLQPTPISFISDNAIEGDQFSQEFTLIGDLEESAISYVAGLYYFEEDYDSVGLGESAALGQINNINRFVSAESKSYAAYGQVTWTPSILDDRLHLTLGGRYTRDERAAERDLFTLVNGIIDEDASQVGASNDDDYSEFDPAFTVAYDWQDDLNVYLRIATGYKSGGSSESAPVDQFDQTVDPEKVTAYEIGMKSYWFDRRLRANLAVFENQFEDMQFNFAVDPEDPGLVQSYNAGEATIRGFEADLAWQATDNLGFILQYAYLDTDLEEVLAQSGTIFDPQSNPAAEGFYEVGDNIAGSFVIPYAPEHSVLFALDAKLYQGNGFSFDAHIDYRYQSEVYGGSSAGRDIPGNEILEIPSFDTVNARFSLSYEFARGDYLEVAIWGRNVFDEEYQQQVIGQGSVAPSQNALGQIIYGYEQQVSVWAEPARYGVDLNYVF